MASEQHYVERNSPAYHQNNSTNLIDDTDSQMVKIFSFLEENLMKRVTDQLHTIMRQYQTPHMFQQQQNVQNAHQQQQLQQQQYQLQQYQQQN